VLHEGDQTQGSRRRDRRDSPHIAGCELDFRSVLDALSDPVRLGIVAALAEVDSEYCSRFEQPMGNYAAGRQFRLLREAGVIRQWDVGTRRLNALRRDDLDGRFPGLLDLAIAEGAAYRVRLLDA
jgi:DNA-binding transcriptional ArsR family regulator